MTVISCLTAMPPGAIRPSLPFGGVIDIPVVTTSCPRAGMILSSFAYRSCPAAFADPRVGNIA